MSKPLSGGLLVNSPRGYSPPQYPSTSARKTDIILKIAKTNIIMHAKIYLCWKVQNNLITLVTFYTTAHKSGCIMVWAETSVILT
jgi:hypothetical protein